MAASHCALINTSQRSLGCLLNPSAVCSSDGGSSRFDIQRSKKKKKKKKQRRGLGEGKALGHRRVFLSLSLRQSRRPFCTPQSLSVSTSLSLLGPPPFLSCTMNDVIQVPILTQWFEKGLEWWGPSALAVLLEP